MQVTRMNKDDLKMGSIVMADVDPTDYPDFSDAYIESANWKSGLELTEVELEEYTAQFPEVVGEAAWESLLD